MLRVSLTARVAALAAIALCAVAFAPADEGAAFASDRVAQQSARARVTATMVARGDSVFHGKAGGGTCFTCHQAGGKGVARLGPDLTDRKWLHGDGGLAFLVRVIRDGVARPRESAAPMPPGGGARLSAADIKALAAYVYSLGHPEAVRK